MLKKLTKPDVFTILFFLSLTCVGLFHDFASCIASVVLLVTLAVYGIITKRLTFYVNLTSVAVTVFVLSYGVTCLWAIDSGMAFIGFLKFFSVLLFLVCFMQNGKSKNAVFEWLPYIMAGMTVISAVCSFIPFLSRYFTVNGRLAGFIQYPNTFALLLLVSALVVISKERLDFVDWVMLAVFLFGIFYSGSRTVFVLTVIGVILCLFCTKKKSVRIALASVIGLFAVLAVFSVIFLKNTEAFDRFMSISFESSTFLGRLLYWRDSAGLVLKHPFGLGFMGYYYIQQSVQTGMYSVTYAHNELIQFMLDVGWVPGLLLFGAVVKPIFSKNINPYLRVALITFILHSLFDFNLQYLSVLVLLLLFTDITGGKKYEFKNKKVSLIVISSALSLVFVYFSVVLMLYNFGKTEVVHSLYPAHTQNEIARLGNCEDTAELDVIADGILKRNEYLPIAYSAKARHAFANGDITSLIQYKTKVFEIAPFQYEEYEEYCYMLIHSISLYENAGDEDSAEYCKNELTCVYDVLCSLEKRLSGLGRKIQDIPRTQLPDDVREYILNLKK